MFLRIRVVGMHLHRKLVAGENKFREQRNSILAGETCSGPFGGHLRPGLAERLSRERPDLKAARFAGQPNFSDASGKSLRVRIERLQRWRAPDARDAERLEARGRNVHE